MSLKLYLAPSTVYKLNENIKNCRFQVIQKIEALTKVFDKSNLEVNHEIAWITCGSTISVVKLYNPTLNGSRILYII